MGKIIYLCLAVICAWGMTKAYGQDLGKLFDFQRLREKAGSVAQTGSQQLSRQIMKRVSSSEDRELYSSSVILKNLSIVRKQTPLSADYIYENLMENSTLLRPMYSQMLALYRAGKDQEAFQLPADFIGTKQAKSFALILAKLDKLNPAELVEQMEIFQSMMMEKRVTSAVKRIQRNSVIVTALSSACVFCLLINFTVVVVFMDAVKMLNGMFA